MKCNICKKMTIHRIYIEKDDIISRTDYICIDCQAKRELKCHLENCPFCKSLKMWNKSPDKKEVLRK